MTILLVIAKQLDPKSARPGCGAMVILDEVKIKSRDVKLIVSIRHRHGYNVLPYRSMITNVVSSVYSCRSVCPSGRGWKALLDFLIHTSYPSDRQTDRTMKPDGGAVSTSTSFIGPRALLQKSRCCLHRGTGVPVTDLPSQAGSSTVSQRMCLRLARLMHYAYQQHMHCVVTLGFRVALVESLLLTALTA